jgi:isochorismate pyruvate lyase
MTNPVKPEECSTMADVRHGIDALDARIVALIGERFRYIEAAARIKDHRDAVRDEARKAQVIDHAARVARESGVPEVLIRQIYELLVEASIAHELDYFDGRQASASG